MQNEPVRNPHTVYGIPGIYCHSEPQICAGVKNPLRVEIPFLRLVSIFLLFVTFLTSTLSTAFAATDELFFMHCYHLGSSTTITDESDAVVHQQRNFSYGSDRITLNASRVMGDSPLPTERNFTGQIKDNSTHLHYYNARYYDPTLGTFTSADTMGQGFVYAAGNPIMNTDPTGHMVDPGGGGTSSSSGNKSYPVWGDPDEHPSGGELWEEMNMPFYLRQTPQGKVMGDIYDMGKGFAFGAAIYGANAGIANLRTSFRSWDPVGDLGLGRGLFSGGQWRSLSHGAEVMQKNYAVQEVGQAVSSSYSYTEVPWAEFQGPLKEFRSSGQNQSIPALDSFHEEYGFDCKLFSDMAKAQLTEKGVDSYRVSIFPSQ